MKRLASLLWIRIWCLDIALEVGQGFIADFRGLLREAMVLDD